MYQMIQEGDTTQKCAAAECWLPSLFSVFPDSGSIQPLECLLFSLCHMQANAATGEAKSNTIPRKGNVFRVLVLVLEVFSQLSSCPPSFLNEVETTPTTTRATSILCVGDGHAASGTAARRRVSLWQKSSGTNPNPSHALYWWGYRGSPARPTSQLSPPLKWTTSGSSFPCETFYPANRFRTARENGMTSNTGWKNLCAFAGRESENGKAAGLEKTVVAGAAQRRAHSFAWFLNLPGLVLEAI